MRVCECYFDGEMVHTIRFSDRDMKVVFAEPKDVRRQLWERSKRARKDLDLTDFGRFDFAVQMTRDDA